MASNEMQILPLCIPDNFNYDGRKLVPGENSSRKDLTVYPKGLQILENIDDPVIVICITGPARSGKSFFLSQLVDGAHFSLGHTTKSHTTGIWIAASPTLVKRKDMHARIILLDAEGTGALKTDDNGAGPQWDTKVFSLCTLISSVLIYNTNQPTREDLQKLGFIAKFSDSICRNSQGEKDKKAGKKFKTCAPKFMWLIRNALLETSEGDSSEEDSSDEEEKKANHDYNKYMTEEVLCIKRGSSEEEKNVNAIIKAIKKTFSSIQAEGIPPPSSDSKVCKNLHDPEVMKNKDVVTFLQKIKEVATKIVNEAEIKRINDDIMTGSKLAVFIRHFVTAVNSEANTLPWENIYDTAVKRSLQNFLHSALMVYEMSRDETITLPCKTKDLEDALQEASNQAKIQFATQTKFTDATLKEEYELQLKEQMESKHCKFVEENNFKSKEFCRTTIQSLKKGHFDRFKENQSSLIYSDLVIARNQLFEEYEKTTSGFPHANEIKNESENALNDEVELLGQSIIKKQQKDIISNYSKDIDSYKVKLPCAESELEEFHTKTKLKLICSLKENIQGCNEEEKEMYTGEVEERLNEIFLDIKTKNAGLSTDKFDKEIERLKERYLNPVMDGFPEIPFSSLLRAKEKVLNEIKHMTYLGSGVVDRIERLEREMGAQIQQYTKPITQSAYETSLNLYISKMKHTVKIDPCVEDAELQASHEEAFRMSKEKIEQLTKGCSSVLMETLMKKLDTKIEEHFEELRLHNDNSSSIFCEKLITSLINEHITSLENDGSLVDRTSERKNLVLALYDKQAKGPCAKSVRQSCENAIETRIKRVQSEIHANRMEAVICTAGVIAGVAASGMGAISSKVASKPFHVVKGGASALCSAAPQLANTWKGIGKLQTNTKGSDMSIGTSLDSNDPSEKGGDKKDDCVVADFLHSAADDQEKGKDHDDNDDDDREN